ncbi:hypothetical protein GGX14DRAFT_656159, partial [Mycena pura]
AFYIALTGLLAVNPRPRSSRSARRHCPHELQLTYYSYVLLMFHAALSCLAFTSHRRMPFPPLRGAFVPPPLPCSSPTRASARGWMRRIQDRMVDGRTISAHTTYMSPDSDDDTTADSCAAPSLPPRDGPVSSEGVADGPPRAPSQSVHCPSAATASRRANLSGMPRLPACLPSSARSLYPWHGCPDA